MSTVTENFLSVETEEAEEVEADVPALRHVVTPPANLHIFKPHMSSQDIVDIARVRKLEVQALCGHRFVPERNVENLATCDECLRIVGELLTIAGR